MIIYENIFDVIESLEKNSVLLELKKEKVTRYNFKRNNQFNVVELENGKLGAIPSLNNLFYFRGENKVFQNCKASIYRNNASFEIIRDEIKIIDFELILKKFP
ncbi:hypothetical protein [Cetobacterium somerae]|uniref:hypothetical protein n=1 Tax=Cetobacterium somerae TaxID=188913 RepID=UPI00248E654D|nr:hypothetical protein [Cetobacterium somerae]